MLRYTDASSSARTNGRSASATARAIANPSSRHAAASLSATQKQAAATAHRRIGEHYDAVVQAERELFFSESSNASAPEAPPAANSRARR